MGWVGYEWLPGSIGLPFLDSLRRLHGSVGDISCPVLVAQGTEDEVVARESAHEIFSGLPGPSRHMRLIEGGSHVLMLGPFKDDLFQETLVFLE
jgi:esterase/lipase